MWADMPITGHEFFAPLLAVEKGVFQRLGDKFRFENAQLDGSDLLVAIVVIGVGLATVWLLATYMRRSERPKIVDNPRKLFQELCKLHRLERHEAALLRAVAEAVPLENPALLFVDPGLLDAAILDARWADESAELARYRELFFNNEELRPQAANDEPVVV